METVSPAPDSSLNANPSSVKSDDSSPRPESGRGSPPPKCAICLGTCRNKSFTDSCLHQFCFTCLLTWSKVKAECPLCKQVFKSIIHNVRSNHQYEEYMVEQTPEIFNLENLSASGPRRFRYRTTLTLPLRDSMVFEHFLQQHQLNTNVIATRPQHSPTSFRRTVYRHNLWARPLPDFTGRFRDCTPEFYRYNDAQIHRLVPWLNRELHYLLNENTPHASYVLSRIMELLREYPINSQDFRNAVHCYFGDRTEHFLHELYCFASTPYDMTGYDRAVQYSTDPRVSTMVNEVLSSSDSDRSFDSDIVMVTSSAPLPPLPTAGPSRPPPAYPPPYLPAPVVPIETISHSDTDDDDVLVVGYIKPPEQRTPEVVDLLGSDSDVVVQDTPVPPAAAADTAGIAAVTGTPFVKIRLQHYAPPLSPVTDDGPPRYVPQRPHVARRRRRRRSHRTGSADSWLPQRHTPISNSSSSCSLSSSSSSTSSSDESSTSSLGGSSTDTEPAPKRRKSTRKTKKTSSKPLLPLDKDKTRSNNKKTESTRSHRNKDTERKKDKNTNKTNAYREDKKLKRKSRSKKDVKSTRKSKSNKKEVPPNEQHHDVEVDLKPAEMLARDQPSTSGTQNNSNTSVDTNSPQSYKRDVNREQKRLKSVVKVMNRTQSDSSDTPPNIVTGICGCGKIIKNKSSNKIPKKKARKNVKEKDNWSNASNCDSESDTPLNLSLGSP